MYKTLALAILLLPTLTLAQEAKAAPVPLTTPQIVAKGKLINQNAPIPTTTIFTPTQTGLYRLSVYATITKADPNSESLWNYQPSWTDDSGVVQVAVALLDGYGKAVGQFASSDNAVLQYGGIMLPFEAKAGTLITYSMTQQGPSDNSAYSLYWTLERLE